MRQTDAISGIRGIGPRTAARLARLGIETASDLLEHYPRDYRQYADPLSPGDISSDGQSCAYLTVPPARPVLSGQGKQAVLTLQLTEGTPLLVRWFHMPYLRSRILPGRSLPTRRASRSAKS